jgi:general nucleoside transport system permease protein
VRLERREFVPPIYRIGAPFAAVISALVLSAGLIALARVPIFDAYRQLAIAAFGSRLSLTETLLRATPLILTGLSVAVAFRAQLWNIGGEGQLYMGAIAAAAVGSRIVDPNPVVIVPVLLVAGMAAGMATLLGPVALRLRFGVDEAITGLLLNFVVLLFVRMMVEGPMRDPMAFGWPHSTPIDPAGMLPMLVERSRLHVGFLIAVAMGVVIWVIQSRTVLGFEGRAAGLNAAAANFSGISLPAVTIKVALMSGGLAGLAGAIEVIGVKGFVATDLSPGYGYTGIVVAMLAGLHPMGVVLSALFVASIFVGADGMSRSTGIPSFIADVIVAISLITMLIALQVTNYRIRK